jgi:tetratricopeptide (TPR) repeat protein
VPSWAAWSADTARSLGRSRDGALSSDDLRRAVQGSPNSGVLLVELGQANEMQGHQIDALDCYAQAVAAHPTYLLARYRLAAAAAMLAKTMATTWLAIGPQRRDAIVDALERACRTLPAAAAGEAMEHVRWMADGPSAERACLQFAKMFLEEVEHQTSVGGILTTSLRREDRDDRMPLLWSTGPGGSRQRVHWLARSARLSCASLVEDDPVKQQAALDRLATKAVQRGTWWQVGYNAACAYILAGRPDTAITLLEECLLHPGAEQLDARWLKADPDLEPIRQSPRFMRLVERVEEGD